MSWLPAFVPVDIDLKRACNECGTVYIGKLRCPECGFGVGKPIEEDSWDEQDQSDRNC